MKVRQQRHAEISDQALDTSRHREKTGTNASGEISDGVNTDMGVVQTWIRVAIENLFRQKFPRTKDSL